MATALSSLLSALDRKRFEVSGEAVTCWFGPRESSRKHTVRVRESDEGIRLEATVVTARVVNALEENDVDPHVWAWRRNRTTHLVGFRVDRQRRVIAEAAMPVETVTSGEFEVYLLAVASEADRMELVLTGKDQL